MANIFGGVPMLQNGYDKPTEGESPFYTSFMRGIEGRRQDARLQQERERISIAQSQLQMQQDAARFQQAAAFMQLKEDEAKFNYDVNRRIEEVKAKSLLPQAVMAASAVRDWANPVEWDNFVSQNSLITTSPVYKEMEGRREAALTHKYRLAEIGERNDSLELRLQDANKTRVDVANIQAQSRLDAAAKQFERKALSEFPEIVAKGLYRQFSEEMDAVFREDIFNPETFEQKQAKANSIFLKYQDKVKGLGEQSTGTTQPSLQLKSTSPLQADPANPNRYIYKKK